MTSLSQHQQAEKQKLKHEFWKYWNSSAETIKYTLYTSFYMGFLSALRGKKQPDIEIKREERKEFLYLERILVNLRDIRKLFKWEGGKYNGWYLPKGTDEKAKKWAKRLKKDTDHLVERALHLQVLSQGVEALLTQVRYNLGHKEQALLKEKEKDALDYLKNFEDRAKELGPNTDYLAKASYRLMPESVFGPPRYDLSNHTRKLLMETEKKVKEMQGYLRQFRKCEETLLDLLKKLKK